MVPKISKMPVLQVLRSKVKILRRFYKILRGHASACWCVLKTMLFNSNSPVNIQADWEVPGLI